MLEVQREKLPQAYLLILSGTVCTPADEEPLHRALHRASRAGKAAIVIDLSMVEDVSEDVVELLLAYAFVLHAQVRRLILCHVPPVSRHRFLHLDDSSQPLLVASVLDAIHEIEAAAGYYPSVL